MSRLSFFYALWVWSASLAMAIQPPFSSFEGVIKITPFGPTNGWITIGTGFVCGSQNDVVTCGHVAVDAARATHSSDLYYVAQGIQVERLRLKFLLPRFDLAVYSPDPPIIGKPLTIGDFKRVRPSDHIYYYGFDTRLSTAQMPAGDMRDATISAVGSAVNDGGIVDFIEFEGQGIPGYSGGPVFNEQGELSAIMREAWNKTGIKGGNPVLVNRAFSIDILRMQYEPLITQLPGTSSNAVIPTNDFDSTLLDSLGIPVSKGVLTK
jgi:S1-C subfamily serine protease